MADNSEIGEKLSEDEISSRASISPAIKSDLSDDIFESSLVEAQFLEESHAFDKIPNDKRCFKSPNNPAISNDFSNEIVGSSCVIPDQGESDDFNSFIVRGKKKVLVIESDSSASEEEMDMLNFSKGIRTGGTNANSTKLIRDDSEDEIERTTDIVNISTRISRAINANSTNFIKDDSEEEIEGTTDMVNISKGVSRVTNANSTNFIKDDSEEEIEGTTDMVNISKGVSRVTNENSINFIKDDSEEEVERTVLQSYRNVSHVISESSSSDDEDVIQISSEGEQDIVDIPQQSAVHNPIQTKHSNVQGDSDEVIPFISESITDIVSVKIEVSAGQYQQQKERVTTLQFNISKIKNTMASVNLNALPDKGNAIMKKHESLIQELRNEESKLQEMVIAKADEKNKPPRWEDVQAHIGDVQPRTFGRQALQTLNTQKALTMDRLEQLHGSLKTCPDPSVLAEDPKGLKIKLMPHQKHAIAWLTWREQQKPSGGILADDMGLGKTLTMIALTLKGNEDSQEQNEEINPHRNGSKYPGGTLVICPSSLIHQWEAEVKKHVKRHLLDVYVYHGARRETRAKRLAKQDIVLTSYTLALGDFNKSGPLLNIKWRRIILDEAHQVRNHKSQTSVAVCHLSAKSRWVLTGTPVHNKELDLYALLKFLRCSPFDDLVIWKRWVTDKATGGQDRLNTVMSSIILRRTKQQLVERNQLTCLPEKAWELVEIILEKEEMIVYQKILIFSRTLFAQFLHQRAEKDSSNVAQQFSKDPNGQYYKMHQRLIKLNRVTQVKQHQILVLLLRLRQICCHPSLITNMLQGEEYLGDSEVEGEEEMNLLEQLSKLNIEEANEEQNAGDVAAGLSTEAGVNLAEASKQLLNPSHPIFAANRKSSKIKAIIHIIEEVPHGDKVIVVSQWVKLLDLVAQQLKDQVPYYQLDGSVPVIKRMEIVSNFNNVNHKSKVLLLSLTAGGVGLNLIGANHLILVDLHWNPQLEIQAQDRIFRLGQTKPVKIYKLMTVDTIEQRIKHLQDKKLGIAEEVLTGAKMQNHNKLSLDDLKMLFHM